MASLLRTRWGHHIRSSLRPRSWQPPLRRMWLLKSTDTSGCHLQGMKKLARRSRDGKTANIFVLNLCLEIFSWDAPVGWLVGLRLKSPNLYKKLAQIRQGSFCRKIKNDSFVENRPKNLSTNFPIQRNARPIYRTVLLLLFQQNDPANFLRSV